MCVGVSRSIHLSQSINLDVCLYPSLLLMTIYMYIRYPTVEGYALERVITGSHFGANAKLFS